MLQVSTPALPTTPAAAPVAAGSVAPAPIEVAVAGTPPNINQLLRQIQISGTVAAPPENGTVTLSTALGTFSFSLAQLPEAIKQQLLQQLESLFQSQKPITAVVQPGSPPSQAVLLLPPSAGGAQALPSAPGAQPSLFPQTLTLSAGASLTAVILPPDIVVPGAATLTDPVTAQATITSSTSAPASENVTQSTTGQPTTPAEMPAPPVSLLQPGKEVVVRVETVALPSSPAPAPTASNQIAATVVGNGTNGQLILKAGDATLYVRAPAEAPIGTNLLVTLEAPKPANIAVLPPPPDAQSFASLQETVNALAQISPQLAQQFIETHIPQPNAQLSGPLLFFLSALKQGDVKGWLGGDAMDSLTKAGKLELLARLLRDMGETTQTQRDPTVGEWKTYPIPMHNNGQLQTLTLHVHADGQKSSSEGAEGVASRQTRFLIDVNMSRLGLMQLDGLVRPKKLDMIVRSQSILPPGLPQDLRSTYLRTLEAMGYTGGLSFQTGRQHWITPRKETPQSAMVT